MADKTVITLNIDKASAERLLTLLRALQQLTSFTFSVDEQVTKSTPRPTTLTVADLNLSNRVLNPIARKLGYNVYQDEVMREWLSEPISIITEHTRSWILHEVRGFGEGRLQQLEERLKELNLSLAG